MPCMSLVQIVLPGGVGAKHGLWTLDSGLDSWTGLWTETWTGFWTDTQFNDDHFQHGVALNGLSYALATAYPVCSKTRLLFMPFMLL